MTDRPQPLFAGYAVGSLVWHRASGERGVVVGYVVGVLVDYGQGDVRTCPPCVLSDTRVVPPEDDSGWQTSAVGDDE